MQVTSEMRVEDQEFEENEVYAIDIVVRPCVLLLLV